MRRQDGIKKRQILLLLIMENTKIAIMEIDSNNDNPSLNREEAEEPKRGMTFSSKEEVYTFYAKYAERVGFHIANRTQSTGYEGELKYFGIECSRAGRRKKKSEVNPLKPSLSTKIGCKAKKRRLEVNDQARIGVSSDFHSLVDVVEGYVQLTFDERDCDDYIERAKRLRRLAVGGANLIQDYFLRMKKQNSNFFYVMNFGDDGYVRNFFWADARSRVTYEAFGDVVTCDTTYLMNKYDLPLALFVGVNHHGQSILFGCGLLSSEDTNTYVWLFKSWLSCMLGHPPKAIITDQCSAMQNAIHIVFLEARHRWCLWHVMKKLLEKLRGYSQYEPIKLALQNVVYDSFTKDEFEHKWKVMISNFNLYDNEWLRGLYNERHRWVPVYAKDMFWAGMSTMEQSESMHVFFDGYVNSKTTLKQFVEQCDNALTSKVEKEKKADFKSRHKLYDRLTMYGIEKQFEEAYTNAKFKEV
ncbi:protein FAR1-RELATED SEQUENCE 5-like [Camellia sinensis]|uniref:protein FAR1-RELATED SEQUENCE 5-like n=1 Tax=Camellia sinensis TaxID=4442 RepID=UPI0010369240|nr:protein FAR1-RELATED SEQUENCE 5-like [Camellia sinensis]